MISLHTAQCPNAEKCRDSNSPPDWKTMCATCPCALVKRHEPGADLGASWAQIVADEGPLDGR